ncbi:MAG: hypothetical protein FJW39_24315 [Acidobacteria bacterium]|nr:hypothetical protein [Acidobacteriota bacterium]
MSQAEKDVAQFKERIVQACGSNLASLILYGSAVSGEFCPEFSDLNLLVVLKSVNAGDIAPLDPVFRWWRSHKHPVPSLLAESELAATARCFPVEFLDLTQARRVLCGADVIAGIEVDRANYRTQVRQELRAKLLRFRQKAACVQHDRELLLRLMADSVTTFLALARHAVSLAGGELPASRTDTVDAISARLGVDPAPFRTLLELRSGALRGRTLDAAGLFEAYLRGIGQLAVWE